MKSLIIFSSLRHKKATVQDTMMSRRRALPRYGGKMAPTRGAATHNLPTAHVTAALGAAKISDGKNVHSPLYRYLGRFLYPLQGKT